MMNNPMVCPKSRSGSSVVFLTIILSTLIAITLTLVFAARQTAQMSIADGAFNLAGMSVLAEYDYYVHKDYGLYVLQGTDSTLSRYFRDYSGYPGKVSSGRFSTANIDSVKKQIIGYMKSADSLLNGAGGSNDGPAESSGGMPLRTLRHGPTITSLPSRQLPDKSIITSAEKLADNLKNPDAIFREETNRYLLDSYILRKFSNSSAASGSDHFFSNEVEYVICGELSDEKNARQTDLALKALRTGLNLSHIYSDPEKAAAVAAAAEVITPGILGTVTQLGISTVWAAAEATNDVKLLHENYKVPVVKDAASWAIDLDALIDGYDAEKGFVKPSVNRGRTYEDYLRILLFIKDENVKTARIMDLIQINMRKNHDSDFLIQECATGISIDGEVNGKNLRYDKIY